MATVTGLTAARMLAIEAQTVVGGVIDSAGHLILEQHDGTLIDAGPYRDASSTVKGVVELATDAEVIAGTDTVRAVTPSGLKAVPGDKVQNLPNNSIAEAALPDAYPVGISLIVQTTGSSWSLGFGHVLTTHPNSDRAHQTFYPSAGGLLPVTSWERNYHSSSGGGGWTAWQQTTILNNLDPTLFVQTTSFTNYPRGETRLYYTPANSSGWDFSGKYGEVRTYVFGSDYAKQRWTLHTNGGSSGKLEIWERTANSTGGWSPWYVIAADTGWVNLTYAAGYTAGTAEQLRYRVRGGVIYFTGGASGSFSAGVYNDVVATGGIPTAYRPTLNVRGGAMGTIMRSAGFEINTNGSIKLGHNGTGDPTWVAFNASYPIGT